MVVHKAECTDGRYSLRLLAGECSELYRCDALLANDTTTLVSFLTRSPRSKAQVQKREFRAFCLSDKGRECRSR